MSLEPGHPRSKTAANLSACSLGESQTVDAVQVAVQVVVQSAVLLTVQLMV